MNNIEKLEYKPAKTRKQQEDEWQAWLKKMNKDKRLTNVEAGRAIPKSKIKSKRRKSVMKKHK